jgi:hypothetical protein
MFVVVDGCGDALQEDGTFGDDAKIFDTVEAARAARPGHAEGTAKSRVIFASQREKFQLCGCLL